MILEEKFAEWLKAQRREWGITEDSERQGNQTHAAEYCRGRREQIEEIQRLLELDGDPVMWTPSRKISEAKPIQT